MFKVNECGFFASPHISNPFRLCIYKSKTQEPFEIDARRGGERVSKGRRSVQKVGQSGRGEDIGWGMPVFDTVVESRIFADRNPHFQDSITNLDVGQWTVANSIDLTSRRKNTCFSVKRCKRCVFSFRSLNLRESSLRGILVVFFFRFVVLRGLETFWFSVLDIFVNSGKDFILRLLKLEIFKNIFQKDFSLKLSLFLYNFISVHIKISKNWQIFPLNGISSR